MTGIDLIYAMAGIDEGYIHEARQHQRIIPVWMKGVSIAACFLCLLIIGIFSVSKLLTKPQEVSPAPVAPVETTPIVPEEESNVEENIPEETAEIFSPYRVVGDTILYGNTEWGIYTDEVYLLEGLDPDVWRNSKEQKKIYETGIPIEGHPEITSVEYQFQYCGPSLEYGLAAVEVEYDMELVSFDELIAERTRELGSPEFLDETQAHWSTANDGSLKIMTNGESTLLERLHSGSTAQTAIESLDVEAYLSNLQPPNGHFGWTFQQHVEQGLLNPENGTEEWIEYEDGSSDLYFHSTVELGGYTVPIDYYFGPTLATDEYVLKQVFVIPPEDIPYQNWIASFADSWSRKLAGTNGEYYVSPVVLSNLLSEDQQRAIADRAVSLGQTTEEEFTLSNWYLVTFFYSDGVWQYNGTGAALYATIPRP